LSKFEFKCTKFCNSYSFLHSLICSFDLRTVSTDHFHCHEIKNKSKTIQWDCGLSQEIVILKKIKKEHTSPSLCIFPSFRYSSKCFTEIYRAQYENAILVYLRGSPIWQPKIVSNIWNLLWLS